MCAGPNDGIRTFLRSGTCESLLGPLPGTRKEGGFCKAEESPHWAPNLSFPDFGFLDFKIVEGNT